MILRDLLKEKTLRDLVVINEKADLDRVVSTVESTETPDVVAYVPPHTLLLTTAMAYQNCQGELCKLIVSLNQLPCAGMAIKLGDSSVNWNHRWYRWRTNWDFRCYRFQCIRRWEKSITTCWLIYGTTRMRIFCML